MPAGGTLRGERLFASENPRSAQCYCSAALTQLAWACHKISNSERRDPSTLDGQEGSAPLQTARGGAQEPGSGDCLQSAGLHLAPWAIVPLLLGLSYVSGRHGAMRRLPARLPVWRSLGT